MIKNHENIDIQSDISEMIHNMNYYLFKYI